MNIFQAIKPASPEMLAFVLLQYLEIQQLIEEFEVPPSIQSQGPSDLLVRASGSTRTSTHACHRGNQCTKPSPGY